MELVWYGLTCFRLRGRDATVLMDPLTRALGLPMPRLQPDIVTLSSPVTDTTAFGSATKVIDGPGEYDIAGVIVTGIATQRAELARGKAARQRKTAYIAGIDGLNVCHLGHLEQALDASQVEALGHVDILLVPVGGHGSIGAAQAAEVISLLEPRIVVPMRYHLPGLKLELDDVSAFAKEMGLTDAAPQPRLSVSAGSLPEETEVVILEHHQRG
jgi:L-ascorbate metabolism protein UlaG (beta-lactamase superfamily)